MIKHDDGTITPAELLPAPDLNKWPHSMDRKEKDAAEMAKFYEEHPGKHVLHQYYDTLWAMLDQLRRDLDGGEMDSLCLLLASYLFKVSGGKEEDGGKTTGGTFVPPDNWMRY